MGPTLKFTRLQTGTSLRSTRRPATHSSARNAPKTDWAQTGWTAALKAQEILGAQIPKQPARSILTHSVHAWHPIQERRVTTHGSENPGFKPLILPDTWFAASDGDGESFFSKPSILSDRDLMAYIDGDLPEERMKEIDAILKKNKKLAKRYIDIREAMEDALAPEASARDGVGQIFTDAHANHGWTVTLGHNNRIIGSGKDRHWRKGEQAGTAERHTVVKPKR